MKTEPLQEALNLQTLRDKGAELAQNLRWLPNTRSSQVFAKRCHNLKNALNPIFRMLESSPRRPMLSDARWLYDNAPLLYTELQNAVEILTQRKEMPHVRTQQDDAIPRIAALAQGFLEAVFYQFSEQGFTAFIEGFQQHSVLELRELSTLVAALKLALLEQIAAHGGALFREPTPESSVVGLCVRSLRDIGQTQWRGVLEPLILFDQVLRQDPVGCYAGMDSDSRELYQNKLANIARHSNSSEMEVALAVLALARGAYQRTYLDSRVGLRESHVGYYLLDAGTSLLHERVGFRYPFSQRIQAWLRQRPDDVLPLGIAMLLVAIMCSAILLFSEPQSSLGILGLQMLLLLIVCSQSAVEVMNYLITGFLRAEILPKLDFSSGVPDDYLTLVAVPSLLINEKQVRGLVDDLEVRFLGNHDPNIHFALLTDLPDSREPAREDDPLVGLCSNLIHALNEKYANQEMGSFFHLHRHRVYNSGERAWMGWERKRGKLMDLNKLLRGDYDSFPVKTGDLALLPRVRFVITLDSDTELPRGAAHRMVSALAHPLNQAVIDSHKNIVIAGYGILQPRVGVSVQSTSRSRLASIYAGETGLDIYTRAISDAYQDLYCEGIFTGKGIYEVSTVHRVLGGRFPKNSLLSHDLIEGAYARVGLISDIEVIEDYPSHYSAHNRRKHRWLRGDWQIAGWLFSRVPNESGVLVENPLSLVSVWKIVDNLRRSLVEPATFLLLVLVWLLTDTPGRWTLVTICILFLPATTEFLGNLLRATFRSKHATVHEALAALGTASVNNIFKLIFLAHQTLLSLDAVARALIRRTVTHYHLLEWETAAEAETGTKSRAPVDIYLDWMPALALGLGLLVWLIRPNALPIAAPALLFWACSKLISTWLSRPPRSRKEVSKKDDLFLRRTSLLTWRYFSEFSTQEHNWLIPDNVQERPPTIAARFSPTNLGLLLNARQVACELGYLTVPELVEQTLRSLKTVSSLKKYRGHLLNWYSTQSLQPLAPFFVSSVDSGNLLASLWTLRQGCMDRLRQPVLQHCLLEGFLDHIRVLTRLGTLSRKRLSALQRNADPENWLRAILEFPETVFVEADRVISRKKKHALDGHWFAEQADVRLQSIWNLVRDYAPWLLPEFATLRDDPACGLRSMDNVPLGQLPDYIDMLERKLVLTINTKVSSGKQFLCERLHDLLPEARSNAECLIEDLRTVAAKTGKLADEMDFKFLLDRRRKLMSVGFDVESGELQSACYDLLATESRTAVFTAIAKEDIPQETWFLLGRAHTIDQGRPVLLSWTGTMFEYLMPSLWMRSYPNTLLDRSRVAVVRAQKAYASAKGVPWGISESAYYKTDEAGNYQYRAFGLPALSLHKDDLNALVISPYSTFLTLNIDPSGAMQNLYRMDELGWCGAYGFYDAADYTSVRPRLWQRKDRPVRCWMAHHQGMTLVAIANFLNENVAQRWFHSDPRVQATELLLHEKPVAHVPKNLWRRKAAA